jgi:hypothetical protein
MESDALNFVFEKQGIDYAKIPEVVLSLRSGASKVEDFIKSLDLSDRRDVFRLRKVIEKMDVDKYGKNLKNKIALAKLQIVGVQTLFQELEQSLDLIKALGAINKAERMMFDIYKLTHEEGDIKSVRSYSVSLRGEHGAGVKDNEVDIGKHTKALKKELDLLKDDIKAFEDRLVRVGIQEVFMPRVISGGQSDN